MAYAVEVISKQTGEFRVITIGDKPNTITRSVENDIDETDRFVDFFELQDTLEQQSRKSDWDLWGRFCRWNGGRKSKTKFPSRRVPTRAAVEMMAQAV